MAPSIAYSIELNPFYVLDLPLTCSRLEVERQGQKLLAMLQLEIEAAQRYTTPVGPRIRTAALVRQALADLRDPRKRLVHELWYLGDELLDVGDGDAAEQSPPPAQPQAWSGALAAHGWARR